MNVDVELPNEITTEHKTPKKMLQYTKAPDGHITVDINNSSLDLLQTCMRKSYYILERGLTSNTESPAMLYGSAIHKALETYYEGDINKRQITKQCVENFELMAHGQPNDHTGCLVCKSVEDFCIMASPLINLDEYDKRSIPTGVWTLEHYFKRYADDPFVVHCDEDGPMIERKFTHKFIEEDHLTINLFGTIDVVLKNAQTSNIIVADHKTTSVLGNDFYNRLKPNNQYTGYILGAQQELGIDSEMFMINGIQVKAKPKTARGTIPNYVRQITNRTQEDFDELKTTLKYYVEQYIKCKESGFWPRGPVNSCASYGGCKFLDVCSVPKTLHESILVNKFNTGAYE